MKKILLSIMTIALVVGLIGGGIYAAFSDTETSTGNTFTAGTLNLVPATAGTGPASKYIVTAGGDGINGNVVFGGTAGLKPGESGSITWTLNNNGSLDGTLTIASAVTTVENGANEPENAATIPPNNNGLDGDLDEYMGVTLTRDGTLIYGGATATDYKPLEGLQAVLNAESRTLAAGGTITYVLSWKIADDVKGAGLDGIFGTGDDVLADDNVLQSDKATIDITFTLIQS